MNDHAAKLMIRRRKRLLGTSQLGLIVSLLVLGGLVALVFSLGGGETLGGDAPFFDGQPVGPEQLAGQQLYQQYCSGCHGPAGDGNPDAEIPALNQYGMAWTRTRADLEAHILDGRKTMPELSGLVSPADASLLIDFVEHWWTPDQVETYNQINH